MLKAKNVLEEARIFFFAVFCY